MIHLRLLFALLSLTLAACAGEPSPASLRLLTLNVWSGLDYKGTWRMGEYESPEHRAARYDALVAQVRELQPDVIFLQETNPATGFTRRLARELDYDEIHQVCLAGIKFGPLGIPANLKEGNAILARRALRIEKWDECKLSGAFGIYGDAVTVHMNETISALIGRVHCGDTPVFLVNTHLYATRPGDSLHGERRREHELWRLVNCLNQLPDDSPVILGGDFNAPPESPELARLAQWGGLFDAFAASDSLLTWDPRTNLNIRQYYIAGEAAADSLPRRIDGIWLSSDFVREDVAHPRLALNQPVAGIHPSDHYGAALDLNLQRALAAALQDPPTVVAPRKPRLDLLPIVMYDTNTGFGYGAKAFLLNQFQRRESLDLVLFNSSKGERWYRFVGSWPDAALRLGKVYPLAADLTLDYDKWITYDYYGIGNRSSHDDREKYTREAMELSLIFNRGFTRQFTAQVGIRGKTVRNFHVEPTTRLPAASLNSSRGRASAVSLPVILRYDSRNNFLTPSRGAVLQAEVEPAPQFDSDLLQFTRLAAQVQTYSVLFYPRTVLALRARVEQLSGDDLPVQFLLPIGGGSTVRGYAQDRYLDKARAFGNAEVRFPLYWRLSGVIAGDAGKVWPSLSDMDLHNWAANPVLGLRLDMTTFLVRLDAGFGPETTGIYFNFSHIF
jgi:endonuclease/exonuclease/phosphatase family metal-dependent hydrolase